MSDKIYTPPPPPSCPKDAKPATLTDTEEDMYRKLLDHFSSPDYTIPGEKDGALIEAEKFWLSYECILRYLRATKWTVEKSIDRIEDTLKWRREFGIYDLLTADLVEPEAVTGKEIIFGYDTDRRPALYLLPSRQNTEESPRQVQHVVWMLERCIDLMGPGVEMNCLLINYADKGRNVSLSMGRTVLSILQNHYPERLGRALILNLPFLLNVFYKLITPFIDPVTRSKMKFNPQVVEDGIFAADMVMKEWGGSADVVYEHDTYWPALDKMCEERRTAWMEKWRTLGGKVGVKEWDYKDGSSGARWTEQQNGEKVADVITEEPGIKEKLDAIAVST